ncbi:GMC oxidoreductase [Mycobacterium ulcerans]|uniref:GMC oxidoreductase n=1 Tax=Mycobacterium ulcerans TaxID=1809 RepID=UPI001E5026B8|nr:GMC oxidoreductase [Mycobacterium ulcerans]
MGSDPATSVANEWGELHDTPGVFIGDASALPSASGANPMISTMALAHRTAEAIAAIAVPGGGTPDVDNHGSSGLTDISPELRPRTNGKAGVRLQRRGGHR